MWVCKHVCHTLTDQKAGERMTSEEAVWKARPGNLGVEGKAVPTWECHGICLKLLKCCLGKRKLGVTGHDERPELVKQKNNV